MTGTHDKVRSLFLAALMVLSVFAGAVALSGIAAANVQEEDKDDDLDSGSIHYQGQVLYGNSLSSSEPYQLRRVTDGGTEFVREFNADGDNEALIKTSSLSAGTYVVQNNAGDYIRFDGGAASVDANGKNSASWEVAEQSLDLTASPSSVGNSGDNGQTNITVDTNRGSSTNYTVTAANLTDSELADILGGYAGTNNTNEDGVRLENVEQGSDIPANFNGIDAGSYSLEFSALDTTASDSVNISVSQVGAGTASFSNAVVQEDRGDIVEFTVNLEDTDSATVNIGDTQNVNYFAQVDVTDNDGDGQVTVQMNSFAPNDMTNTFSAPDGSQDVVSASNIEGTSSVLDASDYSMNATIGGDEKDVATLSLSERGTGDVNTWTSPANDFGNAESGADVIAAINDGSYTQRESVANKDTATFQIQSSGIFGAIEDKGDFLDLVTSRDDINLTMVQTNPSANQERKRLDINDSRNAINVIPDEANNTVYVEVKTDQAQFERISEGTAFTLNGNNVSAAPGERYETTFSISADSPLVTGEEDESATSTVRLTERTARFDAQSETSDGAPEVIVEAASGQQITGTTTVAPGTTLSVRARATGDSPFLKSTSSTVGQDGTFSAELDFSNVAENQTFTMTIPNKLDSAVETAGRVAGAPEGSVSISDQESDGTTVTVDSVTLSQGGFVTIHDSSVLEDGGVLQSVLGTSQYLEAGQHSNVEVSLDSPISESQTVVAMPHQDTNGNQQYDFVDSEGDSDGPYTADGEAVTDSASVTVQEPGDDGTPTDGTPTDTPEDGTPTDTPDEDTPTDTETDGQPGFGLIVSVIALLGAALLALRRD